MWYNNIITKGKEVLSLKYLKIRVDEKLHKSLKIYCIKEDITLQDFVLNAIIQKIEIEKGENK